MRKAYLQIGKEMLRVKFKQDSPGQTPEVYPNLAENPTQYTIWYANTWQRVYEHNSLAGVWLFVKPDMRVKIVDD